MCHWQLNLIIILFERESKKKYHNRIKDNNNKIPYDVLCDSINDNHKRKWTGDFNESKLFITNYKKIE